MNKVLWQDIKNESKRISVFVSELRPLSDDLTFLAASLSFYTLFAIIPILWILFSVISSMPVFTGYYQQMKTVLMGFVVPGQSQQVIALFDGFIENSSHMGWVGLLYVVFTSGLFFAHFSAVVNRIFQVSNRRLLRSLVGFVAMMVLAPFMLGFSLLLPSQLAVYLDVLTEVSWLGYIYSYLMLCLLFYCVFKFSPNTEVSPLPALMSAIITASLWQAAKTAFLYYIVLNQTYNTIYGSFSLLLFTLLWIYLSWVLCLYGLKLCYHLQHYHTNRLQPQP
ncbi:MAG: YihY/virulence factor BrkB family protein [Gammaproteobacteria bacterium]|nr:YihY/virulence factor BrkB family protein [Gammaproteobacteria bacterium]